MSNNPIVHWELMGPDGDGLKAFYQKIFDWKMSAVPGFNQYFTTDGDGMGVAGAVGASSDDSAYQALYVQVADIDSTLELIETAGGTTVTPKTEIPDIVTFALFKDPAGNLVGIVEGE